MSSSLWRREGAKCHSLFDCGTFAHKFHLEFLNRRQIKMVFHCKKVALVFVESVTDDCLIPVGAKNDSYRRIVAGIHHFAFVVMLVELHLPDILRRHLPDFKVNQDKTPSYKVIKQEIAMISLAPDLYGTLLTHKRKTTAQLQHELAKVFDKPALQIRLIVVGRGKANKLQNRRTANDILSGWNTSLHQLPSRGQIAVVRDQSLVELR